MKRKYLYYALISILGLPIVSCNSGEEPVTPLQYRISWIYSDDSYQLFEYDAYGRTSEWEFEDIASGGSNTLHSKYSYPEEGSAITITSEEKRGNDIWRFDEKLFLNQNGTASHATGNVTITYDGEFMLLKKNYSVYFHYNSLQQLTKINIEEKRTDGSGREESDGLEWTVELDWKENNLAKYSEYSNKNYPMTVREFIYFDGQTANYIPIVQGPILRNHYLPLQYEGILGKQSMGLVKELITTSIGLHYTSTFSYDISASGSGSTIEGFSVLRNNKEASYIVAWDKK